MVREKNPAWKLHASHFAPSTNKSKSYDWVCKYCGKATSSGLTRFEEHLTKVGGNIAPCPGVPQAIADEIFKKIQSNPRRKRNFLEVEETISSHAPPPPPSNPSNAPSPAASGSASVADASASASASSRRHVHVRQASVMEASG